ncbi:kinase [Peribacillus sp. V2I11]|uniref:kinase n=1 Tax=Peribacillus sp. V2I11 TaxID=3042277 RepID=UPI00277EDCBC|nr:kinase [Peribacillus sp. V2I11]MDQ0879899.1 putative Ser/Thr protein kinase [Peribacillus sp. V2I11]
MEDFKSIKVASLRKGDKVEVIHNPTSYPLIGRGNQGAVFKISSDQCIKIFHKPMHAQSESEALKVAQGSPIVAKLYGVGENYIIMEYIEGPSLQEYLKSKGNITEDITKKILFLIKEMKRIKFTRLDSRLKEIIVTKQGDLKMVDLVSHFTKKYEIPQLLLGNLKKLGLLSSFLEQVKKIDPQSYLEWKDFLC